MYPKILYCDVPPDAYHMKIFYSSLNFVSHPNGIARHNYDFGCNTLDYLCGHFNIPEGRHHRAGDDAEMCARLFLREIKDAGWCELEEMSYCNGKL